MLEKEGRQEDHFLEGGVVPTDGLKLEKNQDCKGAENSGQVPDMRGGTMGKEGLTELRRFGVCEGK